MTCKDCIHYEACKDIYYPMSTYDEEAKAFDESNSCDGCQFYSDKTRFVELPCKSGQTVYELTTSEEIKRRKIKDIIYDNKGFRLRLEPYYSYEYYLNETVFLTREKAEKALKERERE